MAKKLQVIFVGAEATPLAKVGGLGDVMGSLPLALSKVGVEVKVILPFYGIIDSKKYRPKKVAGRIRVDLDGRLFSFDIFQCLLPNSKVKVFLIKHPLFNARQIYQNRKNNNDVERFTFFSKAAVETIRYFEWQPDVVHVHDWHAGLVPTFIDEYSLVLSKFRNIKTLYTIHNLANQGISGLDIVDYAALHVNLTPALMEDYYDQDGQVIDIMKIAILSADMINTVSPNYAKEILSTTYGEGMEKYLLRRRKHLVGILNGIDTDFFDPSNDKNIKTRYNISNAVSGKFSNKKFLQKKMGLRADSDAPLYGFVSRIVEQKGIDILVPAMEKFLAGSQAQFIILGSGEKKYERQLTELAKQFDGQIHVHIGFDAGLAQQIYAGADFFVMPSHFEPCGLGQMIACRYGTIPIVRDTGGLHDSIKNGKTGIVFKEYTAEKLLRSLKQADKLFGQKSKMVKMIKQCMHQDFSWQLSAKKYKQIYERLS